MRFDLPQPGVSVIRAAPQGAVKSAWAAIIDVFDAGLLTQFGVSQTRREPLVLPPRYFAIEQKPKPFVMAETVGFTGGGCTAEMGTYGALVRLLLLTAQRCAKVAAMQWDD